MKIGMAFLTLLLNSGLIFIGATAHIIPEKYQNSSTGTQNSFHRLQTYVIPQHYDVNIIPYITKDENTVFDFCGNVTIDIMILTETHFISLHAQRPYIKIHNYMLVKDDTEIKSSTDMYHDKSNIFIIFFATTLVGKYSLTMQFNGTSSHDGNGFFKTSYKNRKGRTVYLVGTHFQPIGARRVFPCWDEPGTRSNFTITVYHLNTYTALSNTLQEKSWDMEHMDKETEATRFITPAIPAYLAAAAITKFEEPNIKFKIGSVWFRQNLSHHINFTQTVVTRVAEHLQTKWKNEKGPEWLEIVSIPGLQDNGIANWGLIFYREADIVYHTTLDPAIQKIKVASLVAREMAHQWFGNYISPFWWHDLWVNDGIAMLLGMEAIDKIYPNFRIMDLFVVQTLHESLHLDGYFKMPPFSKSNIRSPTEINSLFSFRYLKASAIMRMVKYVLTDDVFWYGAELHLWENKFGAATSAAFWSNMEMAQNRMAPSYYFHIQYSMKFWTDKIYYPVLIVERDYQNASNVLISIEDLGTQEDNKWWIPVSITTQTKHNFSLPFRDHGEWLKTTSSLPPSCEFSLPYEEGDWVIVNLQQTGYYRVNYDETNWKRIAQFLRTEKYTDIHVLNRAQIIDDAFHLMLEYKLYVSVFWDLTAYLWQETDYIAWYPMFKALEYMSSIFSLPEARVTKIKERITSLLTDLLGIIGYNENPNENDLTKSLRQEATRWACALNASACIRVAANKLVQHIKDPGTHKLLPWWKYWTYCNGVIANNDKLWTILIRKYENTSDHNILKAMACCKNFHTIKIYLEVITSNGIIKKSKDRVYGFFYIVAKHAGKHEVFDHLLDQFQDIKPKAISMNAALVHFINHVYIDEQLDAILDVMKDRTNRSTYHKIEAKIKIRSNEIRNHKFFLTNF